jgi:methionine biosynthesis protein MetW
MAAYVGARQLKILLGEISTALTQKNPEFPEVFDDYEQYHEVVSTGRIERFKLISEWIENNSSILDVGVGDGLIAEQLAKRKAAQVTGLDISNKACEKAHQKGIEVNIQDINNGLNLPRTFDYILLMEVIEHTVYPQKVLRDAVRHSTKGVIVTIPNSAYIKWRLQLLRGYTPRQSFTHLHQWSIRDFELFCKALNIKIVCFKTFLPSWLLPFRNLLAWKQCWLLAPSR